ncbi:DMT family transporter [Desertihabitans aurantiacus]|uniref:DMT family transporter n=1 Tax=Desertihabitans aurantiacus TaxID=2282477 RepID=UPI000DF86570|nr:multidrug efflux SMR transporter [Desertihabitans aurantiacus]
MSWLFLAVAILLEVGATMSLRASEGLRKRWWAVPVVLGYVLAFGCLSLALQHGMPLGVAYGIWTATGVALTAVLARVVFDEPLTPTMAVGIVLIAAGVLVVELGSGAAG